jgi:hypothetical protein
MMLSGHREIMNHSHKEKPPEKDLICPMVFCAFLGLGLFVVSAWAFIHRGDLVIKKEAVPIANYNRLLDLVLTLTTQMPIYLGLAFFWITYALFRTYRKCRQRNGA